MNKQKQLIRRLTKNAIATMVAIAFVVGLYIVSLSFNADATMAKKQAEDAFNADNAKMMSYKTQIDKSGSAERRFIELQRTHLNPDYSANVDKLGAFLSKLKTQHRLPELKVLNSVEKQTDRTDLQNLDYAISLRQGMSISMIAMSDLHVFSFVNSLLHEGNGLFNITKFRLSALGDMDNGAITKMQAGERVSIMQANIDFDWVGITPKDAKKGNEAQP